MPTEKTDSELKAYLEEGFPWKSWELEYILPCKKKEQQSFY